MDGVQKIERARWYLHTVRLFYCGSTCWQLRFKPTTRLFSHEILPAPNAPVTPEHCKMGTRSSLCCLYVAPLVRAMPLECVCIVCWTSNPPCPSSTQAILYNNAHPVSHHRALTCPSATTSGAPHTPRTLYHNRRMWMHVSKPKAIDPSLSVQPVLVMPLSATHTLQGTYP
jgi:hypothetical protein